MPSELDPAYGNYLPPSQWDETPTQGMKRIEAEMQDRPNTQRGRLAAGAGRSLEGYNARVGAQGPVGGGVMVAADPVTGQPVMVAGQAQAGPLSYQYSKPTVRGAPASQQIGVGGRPFDADAYFGVSAQQGPGGRTYGANVSQSGEDGGWSAYGGYNPTNRSANVGGSYQTNFATGGRAVVGHTTAAGEPVSLEEHKGEIRHRQDSGNSRMAADYGYIDTSKPDHDGMKTDAFVGPHRDSKKVFVVNQQHPHTGKFNEHKVLLGYKDRAHALRDYAHSFADGLGHKRIQSVVEMGTHELKDWLKKPHTEPLHKADGGEVKAAFADGGEVDAAPVQSPQSFDLEPKVEETVQDVVGLAQKGDLDQRKIAFLLRKASTGTMPKDVSYTFAGEILNNDTQALIERFNRYPRSIRVLARVDLALGGMGGQSLGTLANQKMRSDPASPEGKSQAGYAKGGKVVRKPHTGGPQAFAQFSDYALRNYGGTIGGNMVKRAGGDAAKLMFALNQYTKNLLAQDPQHGVLHHNQLQQLHQIAKANQINPKAAFNRTPDTMQTREELQDILKSDHKLNPAFKKALKRMDKLVGSQ